MPKKISILTSHKDELSKFCESVSYPKFHATQILEWVFKKYALTFDDMSNVPKELRALLDEKYYIHSCKIEKIDEDSYNTQKLLISLYDNKKIESVIMSKADKVSLCLSSQVGCAFRCSFCATGTMGFTRDLTTEEILAQFALMRSITKRVTSVVFMGMGEPLANTKNLFKAIDIINSSRGFNLGIRHITISTAGEIVGIKHLIERDLDCRLSVSLHSLRDEVRNEIMPISRKYALEDLIRILKRYSERGKRMITLEWTLIEGVNDSVNDAYRIVNLKKEFPFKVNIIPLNPVPHYRGRCPSKDKIIRFKSILHDNGVEVVERYRKGRSISAGCGQLVIKEN